MVCPVNQPIVYYITNLPFLVALAALWVGSAAKCISFETLTLVIQ
jgi:hypothetical protein